MKKILLFIIFFNTYTYSAQSENVTIIPTGINKIKEGINDIISATKSYIIKKRNDNPKTINLIKTIVGSYALGLGIKTLQDYYNPMSTEGMEKLAVETNTRNLHTFSKGVLLTLYGGRTLVGVIDYMRHRK